MLKLACLLSVACLAQAEQTLRQQGANPFGNGRIVDGEIVKPHSIPYQVGLHISRAGSTRRSFCGGSLISENYVMTAAHCADGASEIEVVLGAHEINANEPTQVRITSTEFTVHEDWDWDTIQNDIALLKLSKPAPLNENIKLATLPSYSDAEGDFAGLKARGSGWGKVGDKESTISPFLRKVDLDTISNDQCNEYYLGQIAHSQICSKGKGSKGPCNGDSGGPLVIQGDKQVGIASFVTDFGCEAGWPAGWCRVSSFLDWIAKHSDVKIKP